MKKKIVTKFHQDKNSTENTAADKKIQKEENPTENKILLVITF